MDKNKFSSFFEKKSGIKLDKEAAGTIADGVELIAEATYQFLDKYGAPVQSSIGDAPGYRRFMKRNYKKAIADERFAMRKAGKQYQLAPNENVDWLIENNSLPMKQAFLIVNALFPEYASIEDEGLLNKVDKFADNIVKRNLINLRTGGTKGVKAEERLENLANEIKKNAPEMRKDIIAGKMPDFGAEDEWKSKVDKVATDDQITYNFTLNKFINPLKEYVLNDYQISNTADKSLKTLTPYEAKEWEKIKAKVETLEHDRKVGDTSEEVEVANGDDINEAAIQVLGGDFKKFISMLVAKQVIEAYYDTGSIKTGTGKLDDFESIAAKLKQQAKSIYSSLSNVKMSKTDEYKEPEEDKGIKGVSDLFEKEDEVDPENIDVDDLIDTIASQADATTESEDEGDIQSSEDLDIEPEMSAEDATMAADQERKRIEHEEALKKAEQQALLKIQTDKSGINKAKQDVEATKAATEKLKAEKEKKEAEHRMKQEAEAAKLKSADEKERRDAKAAHNEKLADEEAIVLNSKDAQMLGMKVPDIEARAIDKRRAGFRNVGGRKVLNDYSIKLTAGDIADLGIDITDLLDAGVDPEQLKNIGLIEDDVANIDKANSFEDLDAEDSFDDEIDAGDAAYNEVKGKPKAKPVIDDYEKSAIEHSLKNLSKSNKDNFEDNLDSLSGIIEKSDMPRGQKAEILQTISTMNKPSEVVNYIKGAIGLGSAPKHIEDEEEESNLSGSKSLAERDSQDILDFDNL